MKDSGQPLVLVTGSEGLIGDAIVHWETRDYEIASFDIARPQKRPEVQDFINCDLTSDESVDQALTTLRERHGSHIASVVHLAAYYDFSGEPSPMYEELTIGGTRRLLGGLQSFDVEQFIFSSTHIVMKPSESGEPITESSPMSAEWEYPRSKLETEKLIREEHGDIPVVILRIGGVYNEDCHTVPIAQQISRIYEKRFESYVFPGNPSAVHAFVHLDDLVDMVQRVIDNRGSLGDFEAFLVAESDQVSYDDLQEIIGQEVHGKEWPTIRMPKVLTKAGAWAQEKLHGGKAAVKPWMVDLADQHYPVSAERAKEVLGWEPKHSLRDTIPAMIRRLQKDPQSWYETNGLAVPEHVASR